MHMGKHVINPQISTHTSAKMWPQLYFERLWSGMRDGGVGNFLTGANLVCRGHVTRYTFENVVPRGRKTLAARRRDKARLKRLAVLLLLLSCIHTQRRHSVERTGIRGASTGRSGISQGQISTAPLSCEAWMVLTATQVRDEVTETSARAPGCGGTSYLARPANPLPDTEVHQDPGDGQRDGQRRSDLAWFFQAVGQLMHVAPASQSEQQQDYYPPRERRRLPYLWDACRALKLGSALKARVKQSISYSQNSTTALVRFVVSTMEWFV